MITRFALYFFFFLCLHCVNLCLSFSFFVLFFSNVNVLLILFVLYISYVAYEIEYVFFLFCNVVGVLIKVC